MKPVKNISIVDGVFSMSNVGIPSERHTETRALERIENSKKAVLDLCQRFELPEGIECGERVEKDTLIFCSGKKENCPLG